MSGSPCPGRCQSHAKPEAKQKVGVKVRASAAGDRVPPPCGCWACDGQVSPRGSGPVWFLSPRRSAKQGFGLRLAPEARWVLVGRGRPSLPSAQAVEFKAAGEQERAWPGAPELLRAWVALGGHSGARGTCPKHALSQSSTPSTFLVLGTIPPVVFYCPCDMSSTLWPKWRKSLISLFFASLTVCPFLRVVKARQLV